MSLARRTLLATPFIAAASHAIGQTADWDKVVETANRQGHLNLTHNIPPPLGDQWIAEFSKTFPKIAVEATRLGSSEMMQRFNTEYSAGASKADACLTLWDDTLLDWSSKGWVNTGGRLAMAFDPKYVVRDQFFVIQAICSTLASNKSKVKDADAPKELAGLLRSEMERQDRHGSTVALGGGAANVGGLAGPGHEGRRQTIKGEWRPLLQRQRGRRAGADPLRHLGGGGRSSSSVVGAIGDGAPVRVVYPASAVPAIGTPTFVPAKSPNPEAGMVFLNWALADKGEPRVAGRHGAWRWPGIGDPKLVPGIANQKIILSNRVAHARESRRAHHR